LEVCPTMLRMASRSWMQIFTRVYAANKVGFELRRKTAPSYTGDTMKSLPHSHDPRPHSGTASLSWRMVIRVLSLSWHIGCRPARR
jgi:hypothetical protein